MSDELNLEVERLRSEIEASILRLLYSDSKVVTVEMVQEAIFSAVDNPAIGVRCKSIAVDQALRMCRMEVELPADFAALLRAADEKRAKVDAIGPYPSYDVLIRHNSTGEVRKSHQDLEWRKGSHWWWTEGNFGCDCNRKLEFQRAGGVELADCESCGQKAYTVIKAIFPDGTELAIDEA